MLGVIHYIIHVFDTPELYTRGNRLFLRNMKPPSQQKHHPASLGIRQGGLVFHTILSLTIE